MKKRSDEEFMRLAMREARTNLKSMEGGPFGACVVKNGKVLAVSRNTVLKHDATCHAEVNAIRLASRKSGSYDLSGSVIYSTTEPCLMCFGAIHWAGIRSIIFGTGMKAAAAAGFNELPISDARLKRLGRSDVALSGGVLIEECRQLFRDWEALPDKMSY